MSVKVTLPDGTIVECSSAEEAARFLKVTKGPLCGKNGCTEPKDNHDNHCEACGVHHYGMC